MTRFIQFATALSVALAVAACGNNDKTNAPSAEKQEQLNRNAELGASVQKAHQLNGKEHCLQVFTLQTGKQVLRISSAACPASGPAKKAPVAALDVKKLNEKEGSLSLQGHEVGRFVVMPAGNAETLVVVSLCSDDLKDACTVKANAGKLEALKLVTKKTAPVTTPNAQPTEKPTQEQPTTASQNPVQQSSNDNATQKPLMTQDEYRQLWNEFVALQQRVQAQVVNVRNVLKQVHDREEALAQRFVGFVKQLLHARKTAAATAQSPVQNTEPEKLPAPQVE